MFTKTYHRIGKLVLVGLLHLTYPCLAQITEGLVADYSFNYGDTRDEAGTNHAKAVGVKLTEDRFGNSNSAYYFEGTYGSYINLGSSPILKPAQATISVWVKFETIAYSGKGYQANPIIVTRNSTNDDFHEAYAIVLHYSRRIGATTSVDSLIQVQSHSTSTLESGEWYHVVMTYNNKSIALYMNGELQSTAIKDFETVFLATDSVMVGASITAKNQRYFNGTIDDIKIYNRVLSQHEIGALYKAPNPNKYALLAEGIIAVILILMSIATVVWLSIRGYKKELKKQKEKNRVQSQIYEMEMRIVKAQMNPHFIFNAMNSVQQFILAGDGENAYKYLGKFSKLLRRILESYDEEYISLNNEMDLLHKYIEIELLRFEDTFSHTITSNITNPTNVKIPQMLIQPIVENAIWHGLLPKKEHGDLDIRFEYINQKRLCCIIDDNGVGRYSNKTPPNTLKNKRRSVGIEFIRKRLEFMKNIWQEEYALHIEDKVHQDGSPAGTRVIVDVPIIPK